MIQHSALVKLLICTFSIWKNSARLNIQHIQFFTQLILLVTNISGPLGVLGVTAIWVDGPRWRGGPYPPTLVWPLTPARGHTTIQHYLVTVYKYYTYTPPCHPTHPFNGKPFHLCNQRLYKNIPFQHFLRLQLLEYINMHLTESILSLNKAAPVVLLVNS